MGKGRMRIGLLIALAIFAVNAGAASADVTGFTTIGPYQAKVDVYLAPGASSAVADTVLNAMHATTTPSNLFFTNGFVWPQFFDPGRADDGVVQSYNPAGEP